MGGGGAFWPPPSSIPNDKTFKLYLCLLGIVVLWYMNENNELLNVSFEFFFFTYFGVFNKTQFLEM